MVVPQRFTDTCVPKKVFLAFPVRKHELLGNTVAKYSDNKTYEFSNCSIKTLW